MKILKTLLFIIISYSFSFSQLYEVNGDLSVGTQSGFGMKYPDAEKKMVEKAFENAIKEFGKVKKNRKAKEWQCSECEITDISPNNLNVYYKIEESNNVVTSSLFLDDGTKFLTSENSNVFSKLEKLHSHIGNDVKRMIIRKELEEEEKSLKDLEKDMKKLVKKNEGLHKDIENYKEKIRKAEQAIEENIKHQEDKNGEIDAQKQTVESVTQRLNNVGRSN